MPDTRLNRFPNSLGCAMTLLVTALLFFPAQSTNARPLNDGANKEGEKKPASSTSSTAVAATVAASSSLTERERLLLERVEQLERRLADLESRLPAQPATVVASPSLPLAMTTATASPRPSAPADLPTASQSPSTGKAEPVDIWQGTTLNFTIDGYYGYNFNKPVGRINLLRAYDVLSNSFSLNQAAVVIDRAPNVTAGRRFGFRLDLQYGQATETVQGNAANELRPQAYRPIWQAYGTYVAPIGEGLTMDFGKFAASLGYETNYTKDNFNYSRSYWFNVLPYYHLGLRAKYPINDKATVIYHLVNGTQQSEDFNGFKSQHLALALTPKSNLSWQINYYVGREQRDGIANLNPTFPTLPTQPGLPTNIISPAPRGRLHILDTYVAWNATEKLTLAGEADYVISRAEEFSAPAKVTGGALYARYQFAPRFAMSGRGEYLSDRGGLFSGLTQALKETTLTFDYQPADGFLIRSEWRRDFSNQAFFLSRTPGIVKQQQNTATIGLIWWWGQKSGSW